MIKTIMIFISLSLMVLSIYLCFIWNLDGAMDVAIVWWILNILADK